MMSSPPGAVPLPSAGTAIGKTADAVLEWGVPLAGLFVGYFIGDFISLRSRISQMFGKMTKTSDPNLDTMSWVLAAGIYLVIGVLLWRMVDAGWVGKTVGFAFVGMAVRTAMSGAGV